MRLETTTVPETRSCFFERTTVRIASWICCCVLFIASDVFGQTLLWETVEDLSGGTDMARAITLSKKSVVVIGNSANSAEDVNDFVVQALQRKDGATRWTDRVPDRSGVSTQLPIASAQGRTFAAGYAAKPGLPGQGSDIVIRAYDSTAGTLLWNSVWDIGRDDFPHAIAAGPAAVVVVGVGGNSQTRPLSFIVRAYSPTSGAVLWEDRVERPGNDARASKVVITKNRVFVAGTIAAAGRSDGVLRVYNAASGAIDWEWTRPAMNPAALQVAGGRLFMAGSSSDHSYLGVFDTKSGGLLWENEGTARGGYFSDIAINGNRIVAIDAVGSGLRVHSYDVMSGMLQWEQQQVVPPGVFERGATVATNGTAVYVAGASVLDFEYSEMMVRAYDAATGEFLWDDRSHRSGRPTTAVGIALGKKRLFVAGYAQGVGTDFVIRAYDIRNDGAEELQGEDR
jgi:hypothetical protein